MTFDRLNVHAPKALAALRIMTALLFIAHGTQKLFNFPTLVMPEGMPAPTLMSIFGVAGVLEVIGGFLILIGLFTRPVAFILSGMMAVAYFMAHAPSSFFPILNGGEGAILYCFIFFYLIFAGPGAWSLDGRRA